MNVDDKIVTIRRQLISIHDKLCSQVVYHPESDKYNHPKLANAEKKLYSAIQELVEINV